MDEAHSSASGRSRPCPITMDNAVIQNLYPGFFYPTHFHQAVELILCIQGQCSLNIQGEEIYAKPGEYILCFPNFPHSTSANSENGATILQLHLNINNITSFTASSGGADIQPSLFSFEAQLGERRYLSGICSPQLEACIRGIYEELLDRKSHFDSMLSCYAWQLDTLLSRDLEVVHGKELNTLNPYILMACSYIKQHYTEHLSVDSVAKACSITSRYLSKLFHDHLKLSVCSYITHVRISKSINIMRENPDYPLANLALDLGFSSQQYFSTVFKESMSMSPKKYITLHHSNI